MVRVSRSGSTAPSSRSRVASSHSWPSAARPGPFPTRRTTCSPRGSGSNRLLLYVHIADPDDKWTVGLRLDGQPVELRRAYSDVYRWAASGRLPASTPT